jgi:hypothetical protein
MSNYTSAAVFHQPNGEKMEKDKENKPGEFGLKDKLLTSTCYTGPGGFEWVNPKTTETYQNNRAIKITKDKQTMRNSVP